MGERSTRLGVIGLIAGLLATLWGFLIQVLGA